MQTSSCKGALRTLGPVCVYLFVRSSPAPHPLSRQPKPFHLPPSPPRPPPGSALMSLIAQGRYLGRTAAVNACQSRCSVGVWGRCIAEGTAILPKDKSPGPRCQLRAASSPFAHCTRLALGLHFFSPSAVQPSRLHVPVARPSVTRQRINARHRAHCPFSPHPGYQPDHGIVAAADATLSQPQYATASTPPS
jgi:hypothetical protein